VACRRRPDIPGLQRWERQSEAQWSSPKSDGGLEFLIGGTPASVPRRYWELTGAGRVRSRATGNLQKHRPGAHLHFDILSQDAQFASKIFYCAIDRLPRMGGVLTFVMTSELLLCHSQPLG
jgi:hypothetical protein